jgi:hypothetical protein
MGEGNFVEQIRRAAEAERETIQKAHEEEKRLADERHKEKERQKSECNRICHKVIQPVLHSFAEGLEAAEVFQPRSWEVDCMVDGNNYTCVFGAHLPKTDAAEIAMGVVVKTVTNLLHTEGKPPQIKVQIGCYQALPKEDWREIKQLAWPDGGADDSLVVDLGSNDPNAIDAWHKKKLEDCAKLCTKLVFQHSGKCKIV